MRPAEDRQARLRRHGLEVGLVGVAAIWGATFVTVKEAVEVNPEKPGDVAAPVFQFLSMRYGIAAVLLSAMFWPQVRSLGRRGVGAGIVVGLALFLGYVAQTVGLQHTTASNAGFVTGLFVVLAPVLSTVVLRRPPGLGLSIAVAMATLGLALLTLTADFRLGYGDAIVLGAAFSFAVHIVLLSRFSPVYSPAGLTVVQLWTAGVLAAAVMAVSEHPVAPTAPDIWQGTLITGILASAVGFLVQTTAQRYVSPTRTALVLTMEPVFAGVFGMWFLDETLSMRAWVGAALILAAMLVAELVPGRREEPAQSE